MSQYETRICLHVLYISGTVSLISVCAMSTRSMNADFDPWMFPDDNLRLMN
jgi:hypothetical protein